MKILITALRRITASDLDISDFESAKKWVKENVNDVYYDDDVKENEDEYDDYAKAQEEQADERVSDYVDKYHEVKNKSSIQVYRAVCLDDIKDLDINAVGTHWSFEEKGAGCYGGGEKDSKLGDNIYTLTALANPKDIDWEYGLTSFMWYGEDQWECALNLGSKVTITHIDDKKLDKPIDGKV